MNDVEFIGSFMNYGQLPLENRPEYAFIGRSNVGKSSLINTLLNRKNIARISNTPGKTQTINLYAIDKEWNMVDLPGYGYAKISKTHRRKWKSMIEEYLMERKNLVSVFHLIDSRIPPQESDLSFVMWMGEKGIPFSFVFTKIDKLKPSELVKNLKTFNNTILESWESLPSCFTSSSITKVGKEEILQFISITNRTIKL